MSSLRFYQVVPRPCRHDRRGRPHRTWRALWRCLCRHGVPGFRLVEEVRA